jgi:hypothetical protein
MISTNKRLEPMSMPRKTMEIEVNFDSQSIRHKLLESEGIHSNNFFSSTRNRNVLNSLNFAAESTF